MVEHDQTENLFQFSGAIFHHFGFATKSIQKSKVYFLKLGFSFEYEFEDEIQGVKGCFISSNGLHIELLENLPGSQTLDFWINSGISFYHMAFEVVNLENTITWASNNGGKLVSSPQPAVAFNGNKVCFIMFRDNQLIELIER